MLVLGLWPALLFAQAARPGPPKPPAIPEEWWTGKIDRPIQCKAQKYPAILGFDFRYWTGLDFQIDLKQFLPLQGGRRLYVLFRVTPEGREPRYFMQREYIPGAFRLPPNVKIQDLQITVGGGVHLGEGRYKIDAMTVDQDGRACRANWQVVAKPIAEPLRQQPLTVETPPARKAPVPGEPRERVAIVANADAFFPRRYGTKLSARDRSTLIDSLQSLVDTWDTADFSLHVIDIERRNLLLKEPRLEPAIFEKLSQTLQKIDMQTVDYGSLKRGARGEFVAQLVERSMSDWASYDAVVFIGPAWRWFDKLPDSARKKLSDLPRVSYLAFTPLRFPPANLIKQFVDAQDGRVYSIQWPADLARAIKKIRQEKR